MSQSTPQDEVTLKAPPIGESLRAALENMEPVRLRKPMREFIWFVALSLPFIVIALLGTGVRGDLKGLSPLWIGSVALVWFASFAGAAYLGFVPAKGQVLPRSRGIRHIVMASSAVVIAIGLFATQAAAGMSTTYEASAGSVLAHAGGCSVFGLGTGVVPGLVALFVMHRYVPVGRFSIGLSLGAAGGSLSGLALLFHCPIAEPFHVGLVHGSAIAISAFFVAGAAQLLLKRR